MLYFFFNAVKVSSVIPSILVASLFVLAILITELNKASFTIATVFDHKLKPYNFPLLSLLEHSSLRPIISSRVNADSIISNASLDLPSVLSLSEKDKSLQKPWESDFRGFIYSRFSIISSISKSFAISWSSRGATSSSSSLVSALPIFATASVAAAGASTLTSSSASNLSKYRDRFLIRYSVKRSISFWLSRSSKAVRMTFSMSLKSVKALFRPVLS